MDHTTFDHLARRFATRHSRRTGLRALLGLAAAGTSIGSAAAGGGPTPTPSPTPTCRAGRQTCTRNQQCCAGACNVGRGIPIQHRNRCACEEGLTVCGGRCVSTASNRDHCGACGRRCSTGETCVAGVCQAPNSCAGSDAPVCFETIDGQVVELGHMCITPVTGNCQSDAGCADLLAAILADLEEDGIPAGQEWVLQLDAVCVVVAKVSGILMPLPYETACLAYTAEPLCN